MVIARWSIGARFGHKPEVLEQMNRWMDEVGSQIGWTRDKVRILNGSIGALESTIQTEIALKDLAELNAAWDKLGQIDSHKEWSRELEPYIVSGTQRWEIFRVLQ